MGAQALVETRMRRVKGLRRLSEESASPLFATGEVLITDTNTNTNTNTGKNKNTNKNTSRNTK